MCVYHRLVDSPSRRIVVGVSPSERVTNRDDCSVVVFVLTLSPYSNRFPQSLLINSPPRDDIIIELSFSECIKTSYYACLMFHTIRWVTATFGLLTAFKRLSGLSHVFCRPHFSLPLFRLVVLVHYQVFYHEFMCT